MEQFTDFMNKSILNESYGMELKRLKDAFNAAVNSMEGSSIDKKQIYLDLGLESGLIPDEKTKRDVLDVISGLKVENVIKESEEGNEIIKTLKDIRRKINMPEIIKYLNSRDVDYNGFTDLDMIIKYYELGGDEESKE
jgi:hypothetical protein